MAGFIGIRLDIIMMKMNALDLRKQALLMPRVVFRDLSACENFMLLEFSLALQRNQLSLCQLTWWGAEDSTLFAQTNTGLIIQWN